jgi:hypothetical protein
MLALPVDFYASSGAPFYDPFRKCMVVFLKNLNILFY